MCAIDDQKRDIRNIWTLRISHHGGLDLRMLSRFQMRLFSMSFDEALEELLVQVAPFHSSWLFLESAGLGATKPFSRQQNFRSTSRHHRCISECPRRSSDHPSSVINHLLNVPNSFVERGLFSSILDVLCSKVRRLRSPGPADNSVKAHRCICSCSHRSPNQRKSDTRAGVLSDRS